MEHGEMKTMPLLSVEQAAKKLDLSVTRVQQLCKGGRLGQRVGRTYVILEDDLKRFAKLPREAGRPKQDRRAG